MDAEGDNTHPDPGLSEPGPLFDVAERDTKRKKKKKKEKIKINNGSFLRPGEIVYTIAWIVDSATPPSGILLRTGW